MPARIIGLKRAIPYLRRYRDKTFVVKLGGRLLAEAAALESLAEQVSLFHQLRIDLVLVHGGGPQASELSRKLGVPVEMVNGRRVTCAGALEVAKMVFNGKLNTDLLAALSKHGVPGVGLSGVDGGLIRAVRRPITTLTDTASGEHREVDFGYVGDVEAVDPRLLRHLLAGDFTPVVSALAGGGDGSIYNVNADTVAAHVAAALGAEKLILLTDAPGVLRDADDPGSLISRLDTDALAALLADGLGGGMRTKLEACAAALAMGVERAHIISGLTPNSLLSEVFTNDGCGTLVTPAGAVDLPALP